LIQQPIEAFPGIVPGENGTADLGDGSPVDAHAAPLPIIPENPSIYLRKNSSAGNKGGLPYAPTVLP